MKTQTKNSFLFLLIAALLLVACGSRGDQETVTTNPIAVEDDNDRPRDQSDDYTNETVITEGEPVEVPRIVTETVIVESEPVAEEEAMDEEEAATAHSITFNKPHHAN